MASSYQAGPSGLQQLSLETGCVHISNLSNGLSKPVFTFTSPVATLFITYLNFFQQTTASQWSVPNFKLSSSNDRYFYETINYSLSNSKTNVQSFTLSAPTSRRTIY